MPHRDPEKHREYMRQYYYRKKAEKNGGRPDSRAGVGVRFYQPSTCYKVVSCPGEFADTFPVGHILKKEPVDLTLEMGFFPVGMILEKRGKRFRVVGPEMPPIDALTLEMKFGKQKLAEIKDVKQKRHKAARLQEQDPA